MLARTQGAESLKSILQAETFSTAQKMPIPEVELGYRFAAAQKIAAAQKTPVLEVDLGYSKVVCLCVCAFVCVCVCAYIFM